MCTTCNTNCNSTCSPTPCACTIYLSTDCITTTEDLTCSNILKSQTLSEVLTQLDAYICERFTSVEEFIKLINVGTGAQVYKGDTILGKKQLRTLLDSNLINLVQGTDDITISVDETALNTFIEVNQKTYSTLNTGTGAQVYKSSTIVGDNTQFNLRKIKSSNSSVSIVEGTDDIDITVSASVVPDGSETKVIAGTNVSVTGIGTITTPYVINSTDTNTTYSAGTAISLVGTTFNNTAPDQTVVLTQGGATTITGTYPNFTISSTDTNTIADGSETKINSGTTTSVSGIGTIGSPYVVETVNLQKVITYPADFTGTNYTITNADNNYTIIVDNSATAVTITVPTGLTSKIGVGFIQKGTADVTFVASGTTILNPIGLKSKGQYYQTFIEQELATTTVYLLGNTRA
jgi:hypothetical protein